ncbi:MAG: carboxypeptidase-like regulatory domain-containing protein [Bacteroidetes bacterium]|nr:carboxypeptidase-like regulatory domain-containing protein [Bacteroidota bacterium]
MRTFLHITALLLFVHILTPLNAQEKSITGKVRNAQGEALSFANVTLISLPDSSYIAYTSTDQNGNYALSYSESGEAFLQVSYMGYTTQRHPLHLDRAAQTADFVLEASNTTLKSATVNARLLGARVRGDTIVYNLGVYTDNTERVLKDILEKLPGIQVDENGKVSAQGQPVKILIDGKEFFFDQSQMASKNLPARMVESVELINNYNDIGILSNSSAPQGIAVLNIGIKDEFKGRISGTLLGGGGALHKYAGKANLFSLSKNMSLATIIDANNTGEMAFTLSDYILFQGGMQQLSRNGSGRISGDDLDVPIMAFTDDVARKEGQMPALNLSYRHPNNKLKINSYLIANHQRQEGETRAQRWATTDGGGAPTSIDGLSERSRFSFANAYLSADYQPSQNFFISNRAMLSGQDRSLHRMVNRQIAILSDTLSSDENTKLFDFKNYLLSMYKTKNNHVFTFDGFYRFNSRPSDLYLGADAPFLGLPFSFEATTYYRALQKSSRQAHELSFFVEYGHNLGSFYLKSQAGLSHINRRYNASLFQSLDRTEVSFLPQEEYANAIIYRHTDLWAGLYLQRNVGIVRLAFGVDIHRFATALNDKNNRPLAKSDPWKLFPNAQATLYFSSTNRITLSVNQSEELQRINAFNSSWIAVDYKTMMMGQVVNHLMNPLFNASLRYVYNNFFAGTNLLVSTSFTRQSNPLSANYTYFSNYTQSATVEAPAGNRMTSNLQFRQSLRFIPVDVRLRVSHSFTDAYNYINSAENELIQQSLTIDLALLTFTKKMVNGELGGNVYLYGNQSKLSDKTTRLLTLAPYAKLRINAGKGWTMVSSAQHFKYDASDTRRDITHLSASIVYIPPKSSFEFELNANNILNFNKTEKVTSIYVGSFFEERVIRTLPGYIMVKATYRL